MSMGRYLCQLCWSVVQYGERHPCFIYKAGDEVYSVPPSTELEEMERRPKHVEESLTGNSNPNKLAICAAAQTDHDEEYEERNSPLIKDGEKISQVPAWVTKWTHDSMLNGIKCNRDSDRASNMAIRRDEGEKRSKVQKKRRGLTPEATQRFVYSSIGIVPCSSVIGSVSHGEVENFAGPSGSRTQTPGSENERVHRRTQTSGKRFECPRCNKFFTQNRDLESYLRTHTGEYAFTCDLCGKICLRKDHLEAHLRTHTREKPFQCDFCGKRFSQTGHLNVYLRTHTGEMPFKCEWCGRDFAYKSNRRRHLKQKHGEE